MGMGKVYKYFIIRWIFQTIYVFYHPRLHFTSKILYIMWGLGKIMELRFVLALLLIFALLLPSGAWGADSYGSSTHSAGSVTESRTAEAFGQDEEPADWTFMVYMDADNSLSSDSVNNIDAMEKGINSSSAGKVNVIVLWDREGDNNTRLVEVYSGGYRDISQNASSWLAPEMDMASPQTLIDFVNWTESHYPARHYFLDLWDHGGAYRGAMYDESSGKMMSMAGLHEAAEGILQSTGRPVDIWAYDSCLMDAGADNYEIKIAARIIIASEHTERNEGWNYETVLENLTDAPWQSPDEFAYNFIEVVDPSHYYVSDMFAINTTRWDYFFMPAYNGLAEAVRQTAGTYNSQFREAFNDSAVADPDYWSSGRDVGSFAKNVLELVNNSTVQYWARSVIENASYAVINHYDSDTAGKKMIMSETMSVSEANSYSSALVFRDYQWDEMLAQIYSSGTNDENMEPWCNITSPRHLQQPQNSVLSISGRAGDEDGAIREVQMKIDTGYWSNISSQNDWNVNLSLLHFSVGTHYIFFRSYDGDLYSRVSYVVVNVTLRTDLPDLQFSAVSVSNSSPHAGQFVSLSADVINHGNNSTSNFSVALFIDSPDSAHLIHLWSCSGLQINGSCALDYVWNTTNYTGYHTLIFYIDPENEVDELNESNNVVLKSVVVYGYSLELLHSGMTLYAHRQEHLSINISLINTGTYQDAYSLSVDYSSQINASVAPEEVSLAPNATALLLVNVSVGAAAPFHTALYLNITGVSHGNSSRSETLHLVVIVLPQLLLLYNDGGYGDYRYMESALYANSYAHDLWNVTSSGYPSISVLDRYSLVLFTSGRKVQDIMPQKLQDALMEYLDHGGRLYLSSQDLLWNLVPGLQGNWVVSTNRFVKEYLHIAMVRNDVIEPNITGVSGDPVGGNFTRLTLKYPFFNYDDEIKPESDAFPVYLYDDGNCSGLRYANPVYRVVFTAFSFEAVENASSSAGAEMMKSIVTWLLHGGPVPEPPAGLHAMPGPGFINLSWSASANAQRYIIYRNGEIIASVPASQLWFNDTSPQPGMEYTYMVTAMNVEGESAPSNEVSAIAPEPVPELSAFLPVILFVALIFMRRK